MQATSHGNGTWFDESVGIDDPPPAPGWEPSPDQIRSWSAQIRSEWTGGTERTRECWTDEIVLQPPEDDEE